MLRPTAKLPSLWLPSVAALCLGLGMACGGKTVVTDGSGGSGGATSASSGQGAGANGSASSSSGGQLDCDQLQGLYIDAVAALKVCNSAISSLQCTVMVNDQLACPCLTSINVNAPNPEALDELQAQWDMAGCGEGIVCPAVECPEIMGTGCVSDVCVDFGPD